MDTSDASGPEESALALLERAHEARVLVVGDVMLDHYVEGRVDRISPEAPVPVVRVEGERRAPGGAANVAAGVVAVGASCRLVSAAGDDEAGAELRRLLRERDIGVEGVLGVSGRPTTVKSRVLSRHQQMLRIDREVSAPLEADARDRLLAQVREALAWADVAALVDYDKGVLDGGLGRRIAEAASEAGIPTVVDPKLRSFYEYREAHVFKPNGAELAAAQGLETAPRGPDALHDVRRRVGCRHLLVTLGEEGMVLCSEGEEGVREIPSEAREVYDVSGAGDTVTAVLSATLSGAPRVLHAAWLANFAAGLAVSHLGAVPVRGEEIREELLGGERSAGEPAGGPHRGPRGPAPRADTSTRTGGSR